MLHGNCNPLHEANVRSRLFGDYFLCDVRMDELQMTERIRSKLGYQYSLEINFLSEEKTKLKDFKASGRIDEIQTCLDPNVITYAQEYLKQAKGWVSWPQLQTELTNTFGERYVLVFQIFYKDFTILLTRADIAENFLGISRMVTAPSLEQLVAAA